MIRNARRRYSQGCWAGSEKWQSWIRTGNIWDLAVGPLLALPAGLALR